MILQTFITCANTSNEFTIGLFRPESDRQTIGRFSLNTFQKLFLFD